MKRIVIIYLLIVGAASLAAQNTRLQLNISDLEWKLNEEQVEISFKLRTPLKVVKSGHHLVLQPYKFNKKDSLTLPSILVQGKKLKHLRNVIYLRQVIIKKKIFNLEVKPDKRLITQQWFLTRIG